MNRLTFLSTTDDCFITCLLVLLVSLPVLPLSLAVSVLFTAYEGNGVNISTD